MKKKSKKGSMSFEKPQLAKVKAFIQKGQAAQKAENKLVASPGSKEKAAKTAIFLPPALLRQMEHHCIDARLTQSAFITGLLRDALARTVKTRSAG